MSMARRRRSRLQSRLDVRPAPAIRLPEMVVISDSSIQNFPPVEAIKLGEYSYRDHYIGCNRSRIVNALAICHLARTVREVTLNITIPDSEKELVDFAIRYFQMFGMKIIQGGETIGG